MSTLSTTNDQPVVRDGRPHFLRDEILDLMPDSRVEARDVRRRLRQENSPLVHDFSQAYNQIVKVCQRLSVAFSPDVLRSAPIGDADLTTRLEVARRFEINRMRELSGLAIAETGKLTASLAREAHRASIRAGYFGKLLPAVHVGTFEGSDSMLSSSKDLRDKTAVELNGLDVLEALGLPEQQVVRLHFFEESQPGVTPDVRHAFGIGETPDVGTKGRTLSYWERRTKVALDARDEDGRPLPAYRKRALLQRIRVEHFAERHGLVVMHAPVAKGRAKDAKGAYVEGIQHLQWVAMPQDMLEPCRVPAGPDGSNLERVYAKAIRAGDLNPEDFPNGTGTENAHYMSALLSGIGQETTVEADGTKVTTPVFDLGVRLSLGESLPTRQMLFALKHAQGLEQTRLYQIENGEPVLKALPIDGAGPVFSSDDTARARRIQGQVRVFDLQYEADPDVTVCPANAAFDPQATDRVALARVDYPDLAAPPGQRLGMPETIIKGVLAHESATQLRKALSAKLTDPSDPGSRSWIHPGALVAQLILDTIDEAEAQYGSGTPVVVSIPGEQVKIGAYTFDELGPREALTTEKVLICRTHLKMRRYDVAASSQDTMFLHPKTERRQAELQCRLLDDLTAMVDTPHRLLRGLAATLAAMRDEAVMLRASGADEDEVAKVEASARGLAEELREIDLFTEALVTSSIVRKQAQALEAEARGEDVPPGQVMMPEALLRRFSALFASRAAFILRHVTREAYYVNIEGPDDVESLLAYWDHYDALTGSGIVHVPDKICKIINADSDGDLDGGRAALCEVHLPGTLPADECEDTLVGVFKVVIYGRYPKVDLKRGILLPPDTPTPYDADPDDPDAVREAEEWVAMHCPRILPRDEGLSPEELTSGPITVVKPLGKALNEMGAKQGIKKRKLFAELTPRNTCRVASRKSDLAETGYQTRIEEILVERAYDAEIRAEEARDAQTATDDHPFAYNVGAEKWDDVAVRFWSEALRSQLRIEAQLTQFKYAGELEQWGPNGLLWPEDPEGFTRHTLRRRMPEVMRDSSTGSWYLADRHRARGGYPLSYHWVVKEIRAVLETHERSGDISLERMVKELKNAPDKYHFTKGRSRGARVMRYVLAKSGVKLVAAFDRIRGNTSLTPWLVELAERHRDDVRRFMRETGQPASAYVTQEVKEEASLVHNAGVVWDEGFKAIAQEEQALTEHASETELKRIRAQASAARASFASTMRAHLRAIGDQVSLAGLRLGIFHSWKDKEAEGSLKARRRSGAAELTLAEGRLGELWPQTERDADGQVVGDHLKLRVENRRKPVFRGLIVGVSQPDGNGGFTPLSRKKGMYGLDGVAQQGGLVETDDVVFLDPDDRAPNGRIVVTRPDGTRIQLVALDAMPERVTDRGRQPVRISRATLLFTWGVAQSDAPAID